MLVKGRRGCSCSILRLLSQRVAYGQQRSVVTIVTTLSVAVFVFVMLFYSHKDVAEQSDSSENLDSTILSDLKPIQVRKEFFFLLPRVVHFEVFYLLCYHFLMHILTLSYFSACRASRSLA
jgi:hypothetical protein